MENRPDWNKLSPSERQVRQEAHEFCRLLSDTFKILMLLRDDPHSGELWRRLESSASSLNPGSIFRPDIPYLIKVDIPPQVDAHTSRYHERDPGDKPSTFIAACVRKLHPDQVEFTDGLELTSHWLIVNDNFDMLSVEPYFPQGQQIQPNLG